MHGIEKHVVAAVFNANGRWLDYGLNLARKASIDDYRLAVEKFQSMFEPYTEPTFEEAIQTIDPWIANVEKLEGVECSIGLVTFAPDEIIEKRKYPKNILIFEFHDKEVAEQIYSHYAHRDRGWLHTKGAGTLCVVTFQSNKNKQDEGCFGVVALMLVSIGAIAALI